MKNIFIITSLLLIPAFLFSEGQKKDENKENPAQIETNINGKGYSITIQFEAGEADNHPSMALWVEDLHGNFIQPLFVTKSFATGTYRYVKQAGDHWEPGTKLYKASLPYFIHKWTNSKNSRGFKIPSPQHPVPDAYTSATALNDFILHTKTDNKGKDKLRLVMEINQAWDFNDYWHNAKFPENKEYKASCQPSIIYAVTIDTNAPMEYYVMNPIGHGHYAGENGKLYTDLSTLTTAKNIAKKIEIRIEP
ncbi:MAG: hypothetical protein PF590_10250 [Candidatus Delongbacteria bacterium]|nr:hypothetical protein [Candidatus Delongbacteria bacterium]